MSFENIKIALAENSLATEAALEEFFKGKNSSGSLEIIISAEKYSLLGGGKRIRPFLVNEVARVLGASLESSMPFAMAVEMIHTYSLIHDDLPCMDNDDFRRGKPSNHKVYGEAYAMLAGDALLTNAFLAAASNKIVDASYLSAAITAISDAAGDEGMIGGQVTDLEGEEKDLTFDELLTLHSLKTGKMIELSALLGCIAAGYSAETKEARAVCAYARNIGLAFQAIDDLLDRIGDEAVVGKTLSSDAENQKTTFLSFFDIDGVRDYAKRLTEDAISEISEIEGSELLCELATYLLERDN
ncbi:MAG: polyprenyl synthetase family protein [Clostridia bacterium]|nr:polyprenyl synthetase family protein [Clostridia bacterium]